MNQIAAKTYFLGVPSIRYLGSSDTIQFMTLVVIDGTREPSESI